MNIWIMIYVGGFAFLLACVAMVQVAKVVEDGEAAPEEVWKWFVILPACWPLIFLLFLLALALMPFIKSPSKRPPGIPEKNYAFSVQARNEKWDVYYFTKNGKEGTMAFTKRDGKFVIGLFANGTLSEDEAAHALEQTSRTIRPSEIP